MHFTAQRKPITLPNLEGSARTAKINMAVRRRPNQLPSGDVFAGEMCIAFRITTGVEQIAKPIMTNRVRMAASAPAEIKSCIANMSLLLCTTFGFNNWRVGVCCAFSFYAVCINRSGYTARSALCSNRADQWRSTSLAFVDDRKHCF